MKTLSGLLLAVLLLGGCQSDESEDFRNSKEAVDQFKRAEAEVQAGRYKESLPFYEDALQKEPEYNICRFRYVQVLVGIGRIYTLDADDFLAEARRLRESEDKDLETARQYETRAKELKKDADPYYSKALKGLNILKGAWPHNAGVYQHLALVYLHFDQLKTAKAAFEQTLELQGPGSVEAEPLRRAIEILEEEMTRRNMAGMP